MIRSLKMLRLRAQKSSLLRDERGVTAVEFAIVMPVFLTMIVGMFDAGYYLYNRVQLEGAVAKAARDSSLESNIGAGAAAVDAKVLRLMGMAAKSAEFVFTRESYSSFNRAARMEPWTDSDGNGTCNNGEPFEDINASGNWDKGGKVGQGGAKDVVVYEVTMTYDRLIPTYAMLGIPDEVTIKAKTLIANQPYAQQNISTNAVRNCS